MRLPENKKQKTSAVVRRTPARSTSHFHHARLFGLFLLAWQSSSSSSTTTTTMSSSSSTNTLLSPKILHLATLAARLSRLVYDSESALQLTRQYPTAKLYRQEPELAWTARIDTTCVLVFRGTSNTPASTKTWMEDWQSNVVQQQVTLSDQCSVTRGIYQAYFVDFVNNLEDDVQECKRNCPNCDLLITGHSQGGALANVAGVLFQQYTPFVMTFGQPKVLGSRCRIMNESKWFRFILATPSLLRRLQYDVVPMLPGTGSFYGHEIVLSSEDASGVDYVGFHQHENKVPWSVAAHDYEQYARALYRMRAYSNGGKQSIRTNGYRVGTRCTDGSECVTGTCEWAWWSAAYECK